MCGNPLKSISLEENMGYKGQIIPNSGDVSGQVRSCPQLGDFSQKFGSVIFLTKWVFFIILNPKDFSNMLLQVFNYHFYCLFASFTFNEFIVKFETTVFLAFNQLIDVRNIATDDDLQIKLLISVIQVEKTLFTFVGFSYRSCPTRHPFTFM